MMRRGSRSSSIQDEDEKEDSDELGCGVVSKEERKALKRSAQMSKDVRKYTKTQKVRKEEEGEQQPALSQHQH